MNILNDKIVFISGSRSGIGRSTALLMAKKGGNSPTELMRGLKLFNNRGKVTKKAKEYGDNGILNFFNALDNKLL